MRQMLSQSVPQVFSSIITIISVLVAMVFLNAPPDRACAFHGGSHVYRYGKSRREIFKILYPEAKDLGECKRFYRRNGERTNHQGVLSRRRIKKEFDIRNEELCVQTAKANKYANILMHIMGNLGNLQYVLVAVIGGALAIGGDVGLTVGSIASFLTFVKGTSAIPSAKSHNEVNSVVMALAGAQRVFDLMDQKVRRRFRLHHACECYGKRRATYRNR